MTAERPQKPASSTRQQQLAAALRANLKRRKQQSRGRLEAQNSPQKAVSAADKNRE